MKFPEAIGIVKSFVGNIPGSEALIGDTMEVVRAYTLEKDADFLPWFLEFRDSAVILANQTEVDIPPTIIRLREEYGVQDDASRKFWNKISQEQAAQGREGYYLYGNALIFNPPATEDRAITLYGWQTAGALSASPDDNLWLQHGADWLIAETAAQVLTTMQRDQPAMVQMQKASLARRRLWGETNLRQEADYEPR